MRKVTEKIAEALARGRNKTVGNTATFDGAVYLHGNKIADWREDGLHMSLAGWNTPTTKDRLNGIAEFLGLNVRFTTKGGEAMLNGNKISDTQWHNVRKVHQNACINK
jgi:hypothetical protein